MIVQKLCIFLLLTSSLSAVAQKPVTGIWIFKIGQSSIDVTDTVASKLNTSVKLAKTSRELFVGSTPAIFELDRNTDGSKERPFRAPYCEGLRVFYINEYKVANVIVLRDVYLTFKNGILIQIFSDQPESFLPPFTSVHGKGTRSTKLDSTTCTYDGKKGTMLNVKYIDKWDSGAIRAASVQEIFYDNDCQRRKEFFFEVYAQKELTEALNCENQMRAKVFASQKNAERKKLKDLDL